MAQSNDADMSAGGEAGQGHAGMAEAGQGQGHAGMAEAGQGQAGTAGTTPGTTPVGTPPLALVAVYIESPLAAACGITLPPAAFFEFDSASLDVPANSSLQEVATCLTTGPLAGRKVELVGHTDPRGEDDYNRQLGRSRAQSVQEYLQQRGVAEDKLVTRSMGEARAAEGEPAAWPIERRVDIRLLPE
ncbi:MAG: OmpA family protein [Nannocystis sp.]|nr:OmpA family protein [Nannocystis sp.]MBA3545779.1 OmpA family protein [Nannocystis sp.]